MSLAPLADIRILAIEQYGAGPWGTLQLADLGAEVIKIEDPSVGGDVGRYVPPYQQDESSLFFETFNRNKRSVSLDLRHPSSRRVLEDLVRECDAVFSNLRGDQPARLGLRHRDLQHVKASIVCCSLSGFGMDGPRAGEGAYDWTVQGLAGWQSVTGEPDGPPTKSGLSLADFCGGYVAAIAILGGIWRARRDGRGADIDLSLFETALAQLTYLGTWVASHDYRPVRRPNSAHQSMVPFQNFETLDGWIVVACPKQSLWERLCHALERPELAEDERYVTFALRDEHREELLAELEGAFRSRPTSDWLEVLSGAGVPCAQVNDIAAALAEVQVAARQGLVEIPHPVLGTVKQIATPLRIDGFTPPAARGPFRGEDTAAVLRDLCGYTDSGIAELERDGVFGDLPLESEGSSRTWPSGTSTADDSAAPSPKPTTSGSPCSR
jgi:crotonobetainyl-CoA:carnitine CoA-transferase CaiB-like acyl-CoA transferase